MSRPTPDIILEYQHEDLSLTEICEGQGLFGVIYDGAAFNLRKTNEMIGTKKYCRTLTVSKGTAMSICRRLNKLFRTDKFQAVKFTDWVEIGGEMDEDE